MGGGARRRGGCAHPQGVYLLTAGLGTLVVVDLCVLLIHELPPASLPLHIAFYFAINKSAVATLTSMCVLCLCCPNMKTVAKKLLKNLAPHAAMN